MKSFSKFRIISLFAIPLILLSCVLLAGCNGTAQSGEFSVEDLSGRTVAFSEPAKRIVTVAASDGEVVCALGAEDTIVGRGTYCDYPESIKSIQDVGSGSVMNTESIIALKPDCVLMSKMDTTLNQVNSLENAGIKVLVSQPDTLEQTYTYIEIIGKVLGKSNEATKVVNDMKQQFAELANKAKNNQKLANKSMYYELSPLEYGLWVAGKNTFMDEISSLLNVKNCFGDLDAWAQVSQEQVIKQNPDYIVAVTMSGGDNSTSSILSRANWQDITAIKNKAVTVIDSNILTRPGPRLVQGAQAVYDFLDAN